ncbi:MAG: ActS/PrrB/RegB family redox-sensitive histidine kinase [Pseudomonadota bacterium]
MTELPIRGANAGVVQVRTLLALRWLAIIGQLLAILFVGLVMDFVMPMVACLSLVALSAASNVYLRLRFSHERRLSEDWTAGVMAFDIMQLGSQLALTGGLANPFALLIIAPVMVSATTLSAARTIALGALVLACATFLAVVYQPLPWYPGESFNPPFLFVGGVWLALVCCLTFMGAYAFRVAEERRQLADALSATELVLMREQSLHALDGLAAAAAHELGTPLATISVVTRELERETDPAAPIFDDVALLRTQAERCREILSKLKSLGADEGNPLDQLHMRTLLEEIVEPHRGLGIEIHVTAEGDDDPPVITRNPAIHYGLGNLVENAVEFADTMVKVEANWDRISLSIVISDDGPGIPETVLERLGDPFVSQRDEISRAGGMGLGIFIAKTLLERTGATVTFASGDGATSIIEWQRGAIAQPREVE